MKHVLVVGSGRVGRTLTHMLAVSEHYRIRVADAVPDAAAQVATEVGLAVEAFGGSVTDRETLLEAMQGVEAVVSAAPFAANPQIAECAKTAGIHYLDLTEDVEVTRRVRELAEGAAVAFVPQCGVAPGFISLAGVHVIDQFDSVSTLTLRVGALPDQPNNRLKYNLTWSTEGLVNEYLHPCESLRLGELTMVQPLEGKEEVVIDGVTYEAFTTSGGVGTLCHSYEGQIQRLDYKTIRYPGHLELIRFLLHDLRFREHPDELVEIFHRSIPATRDDFVIVSVRGLGKIGERYEEKTFWRKIEGQYIAGAFFTGIEISTAAGVAGVLHLLLEGDVPQRGFVKIEDLSYDAFMATPFGSYYAR
ncbi:MAG: saccharopine dehydrogenase NADP-binding domain-containing protein [Planctomycetota bacterium]|nr:saccharopine dehydrogenase NADP-binding domain-containing protein [Planctomycetota bacterium]